MLTKRTSILFPPDEYELLEEIASKKKKSIGAVIREAVKEKYLIEEKIKKRKKAACDIADDKEEIYQPWEEIEAEIEKRYSK